MLVLDTFRRGRVQLVLAGKSGDPDRILGKVVTQIAFLEKVVTRIAFLEKVVTQIAFYFS